jgi:N-methylhydantoinase B/oxoprolinase/acetone carboxylase alpha subunit
VTVEAIDLVTAEVIRSAMETICFEMAAYVSRTATTPILNQSNERNATSPSTPRAVSARSRSGSRSSC